MRMFPGLVTIMFSLGAPAAANAATTKVTGDMAASVVDALVHADIQAEPTGNGHSQLRAEHVSCHISSQTGGQPACVVKAAGIERTVGSEDAPGLWLALAKTGRVEGGAHSGNVHVEVSGVVCDLAIKADALNVTADAIARDTVMTCDLQT